MDPVIKVPDGIVAMLKRWRMSHPSALWTRCNRSPMEAFYDEIGRLFPAAPAKSVSSMWGRMWETLSREWGLSHLCRYAQIHYLSELFSQNVLCGSILGGIKVVKVNAYCHINQDSSIRVKVSTPAWPAFSSQPTHTYFSSLRIGQNQTRLNPIWRGVNEYTSRLLWLNSQESADGATLSN